MGVFGATISSAVPNLSAIWAIENGGAPDQFFARWQSAPAPTANLSFKVASGATVKFTAAICIFGNQGQRWFVLQLLPALESVPTQVPAPAPAAATIPV